jgi:carboxypeptidase C (cathepsin A)
VLGGGPGLSSQISNLIELGPFVLRRRLEVSIQNNTFAWTKHASLLFVDQPIGTGFTCVDKVTDIPTSMSGNFKVMQSSSRISILV